MRGTIHKWGDYKQNESERRGVPVSVCVCIASFPPHTTGSSNVCVCLLLIFFVLLFLFLLLRLLYCVTVSKFRECISCLLSPSFYLSLSLFAKCVWPSSLPRSNFDLFLLVRALSHNIRLCHFVVSQRWNDIHWVQNNLIKFARWDVKCLYRFDCFLVTSTWMNYLSFPLTSIFIALAPCCRPAKSFIF